jgi:hypothetical protein
MFYTRLIVRCDPDFTEILTAELAEAGFDAFMETADGFEALWKVRITMRKWSKTSGTGMPTHKRTCFCV